MRKEVDIIYRDNRDGELYEDYKSAYDAMLESMDIPDYEQARDWDIGTLLEIIMQNCPDTILDEINECEEEFFKENFEEVDEG